MPVDKDFKRLVRARMQKTGESYTAARRHFLNRQSFRTAPSAGLSPRSAISRQPSEPPRVVQSLGPDPSEYARIAGMSDKAVKAKTGCDWKAWVGALDYREAHTWSHRAIAEFVREKYKVPSWWTQMVTVGYERIKGLRDRGQRRDGGFETSKSKVFALPLSRLYRAFSDTRMRARWLPGIALTIRTRIKDKSMRITWPDATSVEVYFVRKGRGKAQVVVQHRKLADQESVTKTKQYWTERLAALGDVA